MQNRDISPPSSEGCLGRGWQSYCTCDLTCYGNWCFLKIISVDTQNRKLKQSSSASEIKPEMS